MGRKLELDRLTRLYVLKDPITLEIRYVGKTACSLQTRLLGHLTTARKPKTYRDFWIKSLLNKGLKPIILQVESCTWKESSKVEINLISKYKKLGNRLTNISDGGEGTLGYIPSEEVILKRKEVLRNQSKAVYQYTLNGEFVKKFRSCMDAAEYTNSINTNISHCCNLSKKSHNGYIWSYKDSTIFNILEYKHCKRTTIVTMNNSFVLKQRQIVIHNLNTQEKQIVKSLKEASLLTGISKAGICCECKGTRKTRGIYKFEYYD